MIANHKVDGITHVGETLQTECHDRAESILGIMDFVTYYQSS